MRLLSLRVSSAPSLLDRCGAQIRQHYNNHQGFQPNMLVIVTWEDVGHYNSSSEFTNTFQAVLATNGFNSFAIFQYAELQWIRSESRDLLSTTPRYSNLHGIFVEWYFDYVFVLLKLHVLALILHNCTSIFFHHFDDNVLVELVLASLTQATTSMFLALTQIKLHTCLPHHQT